MSISLVAKPYAFSPAYNELKFQYLSTNINAQGFRYIFDIYLSGTSTKIAELKPLPRFGDGVGEVDLSPILKSLVSFDFDPTLTGSANASNSWYKYDVKVGEEFVSPIAYTASVTNNGGYVGRDGERVNTPIEQPLTMEGFECFVMKHTNVTYPDLTVYFEGKNESYKDYFPISMRIKMEIRQDQITGGMSGFFNASLTARVNGLTEKVDQTTNGKDISSISVNIVKPDNGD